MDIEIKYKDGMVDGRDLLMEIADTDMYQQRRLAVIMLTGQDQYMTSTDAKITKKLGGVGYVHKPISSQELQIDIDAIARTVRDEGIIYRDENIVIDDRKRSILKDEEELYLTERQFDILIRLVKAEGEPVERNVLCKEYIHNATENKLAKEITAIRKSISPDRKDRYIDTIQGIGYKWNPPLSLSSWKNDD